MIIIGQIVDMNNVFENTQFPENERFFVAIDPKIILSATTMGKNVAPSLFHVDSQSAKDLDLHHEDYVEVKELTATCNPTATLGQKIRAEHVEPLLEHLGLLEEEPAPSQIARSDDPEMHF